MAVNFVPSIRRTIQSVLILALLAAANAQAARTLMFLVDWWLTQQTDTIIGLNVFQPSTEVVYSGAGGLPVPQKTNAYVQPTYEPYSNANNAFAYWYALPNFNPDDYAMGRIRLNDTYQRGFYQNDSTYRVATDTVLVLAKIRVKDTALTFTYRDPTTQRDTTVALAAAAAGATKTVTLPAGATFRGPKLYLSAGNGGTPLLNQRPTSATGGTLPGAIDKCLDSLVSDTVWIRFIPAWNQQPSETQMKCTGYNPFAVLRARVFLRSPWPGSSPTVEWNGQQIQMYPWPSNPDWMYAELRYLPPLGKPALSFRFRKSAGSAEYFDSSGVNTGTIAPFNYPGAADGLNYWFVPPEGGGPLIATKGTAATYPPLKAPYYLYVQNPWSPGTPRVVWPNDPSARVTRPTEYCGWYKYPLYTKPTQMLIGHSFEDSLFGTAGVQFRTRSNWVTLLMRASDSTYWVQTFVGTTKVRAQQATATTSPATTTCSTDTLKLVMEAFDFKGRGDAGGNPAFQIGGAADNTGGASSGLVKGMVQKNLSAAGLPVYTGRDSGYQIGGINGQGHSPALALPAAQYGKSTPSNWFDTVALHAAVPNITIGHTCLELPLVKTPADNGYYKYDNQSFFPLDTIKDTRGVSPLMDAKSVSHNFLYCLKGHAAFEYTPGLKFEFRGDDDVWVFINKQLAVDLGGTHAPESTYVDIDKLHLVEGQVYPFDIFYCERQTNGSSILIRTSMDLQPSWQYKDSVQLKSKDSTILQVWGQKSQNYRPTCADLNAAPIWQPTNGRVVLVGPDGSDLYLTFNTDTSLYGGYLTFINGRLKVDTANLIKQPALSWNGVYTIYLQSKVGDPLDSIKFTKKYGSVIVQGTVIDADGDGIADSIRLVSPKAILADNPSYHVVWFDASGRRDSLTVPVAQVNKISDSLVVVPLGGRVPSWGIRTALPAVRADSLGAILTYPGGGTAAIINYIHLNDGIAPVADSAYLQYDASGTGNDTLFVWASEPVKSSASTSNAWAILGGPSNFRDSTNVTASILGDGSRFALVFAPGTNPYLPGDSLRLGPQTGDVAGNAPGAISRWVPIVTNTVVRSWMMDRNGDGAPDSVGIFSRGSLAGTNSVLVHWKTAAGGDTAVSVTTPAGVTTGGIKLPADILGGATFCQACTIDIVSGGVTKTYPLADSVPAAAVKASFHYGSGTDTLVVVASEGLNKVNVLNENWVASKPAGSISILGNLVASGTTRVSGDTLVIQLPAGTFAGDSIRLRKWSGDLFSNVPSDTSPWVKVEFGNQPIRVVVWDADGDGKADNVRFALSRSAAGAPSPTSFTVQWGGQALSVASLVRSADSLSWSGPIGPFAAATTAPLAGEQGWMVVGSDSATWRARVVDSVPPVATKAVLRFGLSYDTLIVTASEGLTQGSTAGEGWFGQKSAPTVGGLGALVTGTVLGAPSTVVTLLVAPGSVSGDSLRLRGWSRDAFGNAPGSNSVWVPIEYGPQPIRVQVYDQDGDGRADSVVYRLTRSAIGAPVPTRFGLTWGGNFVSVSGLNASADGMSWRGAVGPLPFGTKVSVGDAGWIVTATDSTSYRALAEDSVAPVATTGKLVFGYAEGSPDTLLVTGSESLALSGTNFVLLNSDSSETGATSPTPAQILSSGVAGGPLRLVVSSGSISGTAAWIRFGTSVSDGFAAVGAHSRWVRLVVTPSGHAALYDADGDGRADSMHVWIRGTLPAGTAVLTWSDTMGRSDSRTWAVAGASSGFDIKPTTSNLWFQKGATACATGNCHVAFYDASGNQLVDWALQDSVAPIVLSGFYTFGSNGFDSLSLRLSEPVKLAGGQTSVWLNWGGTTGTTGPIVPMSSSVSTVGGSGLVVIDSAKGAHADWDSVRFDLRSGTTDQGGAHLGSATPWGPITYGLPAMVARVTDPLGQGRGTDVKIRLVHPVPAQALSQVQSFQVTWSNVTRTIPVSSLSWDAATNTWSGSVGAPFAAGVTSWGDVFGAQVTGSNGTVRRIGLEDGVPPAIVRARYRYSTAEVAQDTLLVEYSEPWVGEAPGNVNDPFVTAKNHLNPVSVAPMRRWSLMDPQNLEIILDTTWENKLVRGDSARLSYQASGSRIWDSFGNRVDSLSLWVPIEFGLRPAEFSIRQQHAMITNFGDGAWPEPGANVPAVEFVVRKDGTSGNNPSDWVVIGDPSQMLGPGNTVVGGNQPVNEWEHVMSVTIRLNRPLEGVLFVYDNSGVSVLQRDLGVLRNLWPAGSEDALRDVRITWNGVGPDGKFVGSGVYLLRAVVKMSDSEGHKYFKNLLWKYGWKRPTK